jgi:adenosine deaminase
MVVKIDLSYIPSNVQHIVSDIVERLVSSHKESSDRIITLYNEMSVERIKQLLEEGLRLSDNS